MTKRKTEPTPIELFLAPLAALARKTPEIEALVYWGSSTGWDAEPSQALEAEEITFYAEGLLLDGFCMAWSVVARPETPSDPDHLRLHFWQDEAPPPPAPPQGQVVLRSGQWTAA